MNITFLEVCSQESYAKKGHVEIRPLIPLVLISIVESERTDKNNNDFIAVMCRYRPSDMDTKKIIM